MGYQARFDEVIRQIDAQRQIKGDKVIALRADEAIRVAKAIFGPWAPDARGIRDAYNQEFPVCPDCGARTIRHHRMLRNGVYYHDKCP
jgi:NAD-dependent SIR2 family protein deacetylase